MATVWFFNRRIPGINMSALNYYAENYNPNIVELENKQVQKGSLMISTPPRPSKDIIYILDRAEINDEFRRCVLLIYLKLYYAQLQYYHQSFDVRQSPFIFKRLGDDSAFARSFCEIIGSNFIRKKIGSEYVAAEDAYQFIIKHPQFKRDRDLLNVVKQIDSLVEKM